MGSMWKAIVLGAATAAACGGSPGAGGVDAKPLPGDGQAGDGDGSVGGIDATPGNGDGGQTGGFQRCVGRAFTPTPAAGFATTGGQLTAAAGSAVHAAEDIIVPSAPHVTARFAYGTLAASLTSEPVAVWIDDCSGWKSLGEHTTDGNGAVDVPVGQSLPTGVYEAAFEVLGDASVVRGFLWVLPSGTHLAVTDIDGTLTTSDTELFLQLLNGSYVPTAYPSAPELTDAHVAKHHVVVYVTGRPYYLMQRTRDWLDGLAFAPGPVHLAPSTGDTLPQNSGVGDYKKAWLAGLVQRGYVLDLAYGNATTDIYAYSGAGIGADHQWIIGTNGGTDGTNAVADSWAARVSEVQAGPTVAQPF